MLVLSRKAGERIVIGDRITVVVSRIVGGRVTLAIQAPNQVKIIRGELQPFADAFRQEPAKAVAEVILAPTTACCTTETDVTATAGLNGHAMRLPR